MTWDAVALAAVTGAGQRGTLGCLEVVQTEHVGWGLNGGGVSGTCAGTTPSVVVAVCDATVCRERRTGRRVRWCGGGGGGLGGRPLRRVGNRVRGKAGRELAVLAVRRTRVVVCGVGGVGVEGVGGCPVGAAAPFIGWYSRYLRGEVERCVAACWAGDGR